MTHLRNHSQSPTFSDSENTPLGIDTAPANLLRVSVFNSAAMPSDDVLMSRDQIVRQYEVDKNTALFEVKRLSRKLADITDNNVESIHHSSDSRLKRRRTHGGNIGDSDSKLLPLNQAPNSDDDVDTINSDHMMTHTASADERFVYQAGHKFFLLHAPWIHFGDDIFDVEVDEQYHPAERFENDKNKLQGERKAIQNLLQVRFPSQALRQRWIQRQVRFMHILQLPITTHTLLVHVWAQCPTI